MYDMRIYLIRHGETDWNVVGRLQGQTDIPMNQNGEKQLERTGEVLAGLGVKPDVIIASPLKRTVKSAQIVAGQIGYEKERILTDPRFLEIDFGMADGTTAVERQERFPDGKFPGMETSEDVCRRAGAALHEYMANYPEQTLMIVSHGGTTKALIEVATQGRLPYREQRFQIGNGAIFRLDYIEGMLEGLDQYDFEKEEFVRVEVCQI